ncbi:hypothetical protein [Streptomyces spinosirectus]
MPLPPGVATFTLTASFPPLSPDGTERKGEITFTPVPDVLVASTGVYLGTENATLSASGTLSKELVANDALDEPFVWRMDVNIADLPPFSQNISVPASAGTVALGTMLETEPLPPNYVVVVGPQGPPGSGAVGALLASNNLNDVQSASAARGHLGLGGAAILDVGTGADTVAAGDDSRLSNPRTPTQHAASHAAGGSDELTPTAIGALALDGDQVIDGEITFNTAIPVLPGFDAAFDNQAVRLAQLVEQIATRRAKQPWVFDVTDAAYGAVGDGQIFSDGAITSGTAVLTSPSNKLAGAVPGMYVSVKGAGPAGVTTHIAKVASVQSAGQVTLDANAATTVSGAVVIFGSDDTAAIQAAVDAAEAYLQAHTYAQVYFPPRRYVAAGPLNSSKSGNGQIVYGPQPMSGDQRTLHFAGGGIGAPVRSWLQTVPLASGACILSLGVYSSTSAQTADINAHGNPAVICGPNEGGGYGVAASFSNMLAAITNLTIITTHSSFGLTYGAVNFWGCAKSHVEGLSYGTAGTVASPSTDYSSPGVFGTGLSVGLLLSAPGNNDYVRAPDVSCNGGYTYAMFATEHMVMDRYMGLYCWAGIVFVGTYAGSVGSVHAMKIASASIENCINEVYILGAGSSGIGPILKIDQLSTESSTPNVAGQAAHMAAARGEITWTGIFAEGGLTHDNPTGIVSEDGQAGSEVREITASTTARPIDRVLKVNAGSGAVTVSLPSAAPNRVAYTVVKSDASGNTVTVDPAGAETINGAATRILSAQWEAVTLRSDGTNWIAV